MNNGEIEPVISVHACGPSAFLILLDNVVVALLSNTHSMAIVIIIVLMCPILMPLKRCVY